MNENCIVCGLPNRKPVAYIGDDFACEICVEQHNGPGKFEQYSNNPEELATCLILYTQVLEGSYSDDNMSNGYEWCDRIGNYLVYGNDQGFVEYEEFPDEDAAQKRFDNLYEDGMGASEDDAWIGPDQSGWGASFDGKPLDVTPYRTRYGTEIAPASRQRALARIRLEMIRTGYYPNVWEQDYHGNVRLVKNL